MTTRAIWNFYRSVSKRDHIQLQIFSINYIKLYLAERFSLLSFSESKIHILVLWNLYKGVFLCRCHSLSLHKPESLLLCSFLFWPQGKTLKNSRFRAWEKVSIIFRLVYGISEIGAPGWNSCPAPVGIFVLHLWILVL